jgi:hypothetical protein
MAVYVLVEPPPWEPDVPERVPEREEEGPPEEAEEEAAPPWPPLLRWSWCLEPVKGLPLLPPPWSAPRPEEDARRDEIREDATAWPFCSWNEGRR